MTVKKFNPFPKVRLSPHMLLSVLSTNFLFIVKDCVTPSLYFEDPDGAINMWPQSKSLIYNGGLDPTLRKKVSYVVWCNVNFSDVIFVVFSFHLGLAVITDGVYIRTKY